MENNEEKRLLTLKRSDNDELRIAIKTWKGNTFIDSRNYYRNRDGEMLPGKGITYKKREIEAIISALTEAANQLK